MTMASTAVTFSVIFSLFFLLSHARHLPSLPDGDPSTAVAIRDPKETSTDHRTSVLLPLDRSSSAIPAADLSRQIAHSFRLPLSRHFHQGGATWRPFLTRLRRGCHHRSRLPNGGGADARSLEIPYGNDMVGFPGERLPFPMIEGDRRQISKPWNPDVDWEEMERKREKKMKKKEKEEREEIEHKKKKKGEEEKDEIEHKKKEKEEREEIEHKKKKKEKKGKEQKDEIEHKKKKKMKKEREEGGFLKRFQEFLNRF